MEIVSHNIENKRGIAKAIAALFDDKHGVPGYIRELTLVRLIWAATENKDDGQWKKYQGQPFWSEAALRRMIDNRINKIPIFKDLRHEHSVPKTEIKARIYNSDKKETSIFKILNDFAHAVIVTKEEDSVLSKKGLRRKMAQPLLDNSTSENVFSRYNAVGIKIRMVPEENLSKIEEADIFQFPQVNGIN